MNNNADDILIRDLFETVNTPYYDVTQKVLKQIRTKPQKKIFLSKMMVAVGTLCIVIAFFGSVKLIRSQFLSPYIEEYAQENSQLNNAESVWSGGDPLEEMKDRSEQANLRGVYRGNNGLGTNYRTLN